jgi:hypothetical protein
MFIPAILRYGIGVDYFNYIDIFNNPANYPNTEIGFLAIIGLCRVLNLSSWWLFFFSSVLTFGLVCFSLPRKNYFFILTFYVLMFCYLQTYSIVRQSIAASFLLCGLSYYYYNKKAHACLFYILAVLFHTSSIIFILIIFVDKIKLNMYLRIALTIVFVCLLINLENFVTYIFLLGSLVSENYATYAQSPYDSASVVNGTGFGIAILLGMPITILCNSRKIMKNSLNGNLILNGIIMYIIAVLLGTRIVILGRFKQLFTFIPLFSIGILFDANRKHKIIYLYVFTFLYFILLIRDISVSLQHTFTAGIFPYTSIFSK